MLDAPKAFAKDTDDEIKDWIRSALERPSSFGLSLDHEHYDEMFKTWSLGPVIEHRDSGTLDKANAEALRRHLASDPSLADDYCETGANHWAVGWVTHLSFRVLNEQGELTRIARIMREWFDALADYSVANESLWSEMETEAAEEFWRSWQSSDVKQALVKELRNRVDCTSECMNSGHEHCTCDREEREDSIEDQIDNLDDETFWEIAVHNDGNGREINDDCYVILDHDIEQIADAILERGLLSI